MIWHDYKRVQSNMWIMKGDLSPTGKCGLASFIQFNNVVADFPKKTFLVLCTDCNKIISGARIIISLNPDRSSMESMCPNPHGQYTLVHTVVSRPPQNVTFGFLKLFIS